MTKNEEWRCFEISYPKIQISAPFLGCAHLDGLDGVLDLEQPTLGRECVHSPIILRPESSHTQPMETQINTGKNSADRFRNI